VEVDLSRRTTERTPSEAGVLRFAIGTMLTPRETAKEYRRLAALLGTRTGRTIEVIQRPSYPETNSLLESGGADFAFVCTGAYVVLMPSPEILAVPVVNGKATYTSLILVKQSDSAKDIADLLDSSFAFVDPLSLTGRIFPEWSARKAAGPGRRVFSETTYTHSHSRSIDLVATGRVRAAGVDSLVFDHMLQNAPARVAGLRILQRSQQFGIPPIVASPRLSPELRKALRAALTLMHLTPEGREVLAGLGFERFVAEPDPKTYQGISDMRQSVLAGGNRRP